MSGAAVPGGAGASAQSEDEALRAALAGEHAAVYAYGVVGAWVVADRAAAARSDYQVHLARRDRLDALLAERDAEPAPAEPAYALPFAVRGPAAAVRLATAVEDRLCTVYGDLVAAGSPPVRELAARTLQDSAVRAARWRGGLIRPFPGDPGRR